MEKVSSSVDEQSVLYKLQWGITVHWWWAHLTTGCVHQWQSRSVHGSRYTLAICWCVGIWVSVGGRGHVNSPNITVRSSICTAVREKLNLVETQMPSVHPLMGSGTGLAVFSVWWLKRQQMQSQRSQIKKFLQFTWIISCLPSRCL